LLVCTLVAAWAGLALVRRLLSLDITASNIAVSARNFMELLARSSDRIAIIFARLCAKSIPHGLSLLSPRVPILTGRAAVRGQKNSRLIRLENTST
jgi:hypothetical protein